MSIICCRLRARAPKDLPKPGQSQSIISRSDPQNNVWKCFVLPGVALFRGNIHTHGPWLMDQKCRTQTLRMGPKPDGNFFVSNKNIDCWRFTNIWITDHTNGNIFLIETKFIATFFFSRITKTTLGFEMILALSLAALDLRRFDWLRGQIWKNTWILWFGPLKYNFNCSTL